jgi:hypothetical protein
VAVENAGVCQPDRTHSLTTELTIRVVDLILGITGDSLGPVLLDRVEKVIGWISVRTMLSHVSICVLSRGVGLLTPAPFVVTNVPPSATDMAFPEAKGVTGSNG